MWSFRELCIEAQSRPLLDEARLALPEWRHALKVLSALEAEELGSSPDVGADDSTRRLLFTPGPRSGRATIAKAVRDATGLLKSLQTDEPNYPTSAARSRGELLQAAERMMLIFCECAATAPRLKQPASPSSDPNPESRRELAPVAGNLFGQDEPAPASSGGGGGDGQCRARTKDGEAQERGDGNGAQGEGEGDDEDEEDDGYALTALSAAERVRFVSLAVLWSLRRAAEHAALLRELGPAANANPNPNPNPNPNRPHSQHSQHSQSPLLPAELQALSRAVDTHDPGLTGSVAAADLAWLLADLWRAAGSGAGGGGGGELQPPSDEEAGLLAQQLLLAAAMEEAGAGAGAGPGAGAGWEQGEAAERGRGRLGLPALARWWCS